MLCDDCREPQVDGRDFGFTKSGGVVCRHCRRLRRAFGALKKYRDGDDQQSPVVDLLTDLRHYCKPNGIDFDRCLSVSFGHYLNESGTKG